MTESTPPADLFASGCYVIAEAGVNHNGSLDLARQRVDAAAHAGADAVKFQTFRADDLVTRSAAKADYQTRNTGDGGSQHAMLRALELSEADFVALRAHCHSRRIHFLSTPFGIPAADLLARVGVHAYKVSSGDLTYHQFLAHLARTGLPIILSTGMATLAEVEAALQAIDAAGPVPVALLHCVSDYPATAASCNLAAMTTMAAAFGRPVGWSDHTGGSAVAHAAVALGARIVEKHITLDRTMDGPDHAASMEPDDFAGYVAGIRDVVVALGDGIKRPRPEELRTALVARRSIVAARDLAAGTTLAEDDVVIVRPGTGLAPAMLDVVIGATLGRDVAADQPLTIDALHAP